LNFLIKNYLTEMSPHFFFFQVQQFQLPANQLLRQFQQDRAGDSDFFAGMTTKRMNVSRQIYCMTR
jgi:hypothetical protein